MASSDLLFPIFFIPWNLSLWHANSWLIGGHLGQALCKLLPFFGDVSFVVSIQNLILIAVDRFGAVVFPLRSPLIRSKLCPFFILATWIVAVAISSPYLFAKELVESPRETGVLQMEESIRRVIVPYQFATSLHHSVYVHPCAVVSHFLLHHLYQAQDTGTPRWTIDQQSATVKHKKQSIAIITVFVFCWLPHSINFLIILYQHRSTHFSCSFWIYYEVTFYMVNACFMFSSNYRKALERFIKCPFVKA